MALLPAPAHMHCRCRPPCTQTDPAPGAPGTAQLCSAQQQHQRIRPRRPGRALKECLEVCRASIMCGLRKRGRQRDTLCKLHGAGGMPPSCKETVIMRKGLTLRSLSSWRYAGRSMASDQSSTSARILL